jgi:hypothetical protein
VPNAPNAPAPPLNDCSICLSTLDSDPCFLSCGHVFHEACIHTLLQSCGANPDKKRCPNCRKPFQKATRIFLFASQRASEFADVELPDGGADAAPADHERTAVLSSALLMARDQLAEKSNVIAARDAQIALLQANLGHEEVRVWAWAQGACPACMRECGHTADGAWNRRSKCTCKRAGTRTCTCRKR